MIKTLSSLRMHKEMYDGIIDYRKDQKQIEIRQEKV